MSRLFLEGSIRAWTVITSMGANMNEIFTLKDAADYLLLSQKTLRKMVHKGAIPVLRECRDIRIRRMDLDKMFQLSTQSQTIIKGEEQIRET